MAQKQPVQLPIFNPQLVTCTPVPQHFPPSTTPLADIRRQLHDDVQDYIHSLEISPDWIEVENRPWSNDNNRWSHSGCQGYDFVQYDPRVRMRFFWNESSQTLAGSAFWDNRTEGPPNGAYGGSIMLVFDEILAYPVWRSGVPAFTANVNLNLRKMLPFNTSARFESKIVKAEGRKRFLEAKIMTGDGTALYADAKGLWIISGGIGGSAAVHPETIEQDGLREKYNAVATQLGEFGETALNYPMCASAGVLGAVSDENRIQYIPLPNTNSVLPYQQQNVENNVSNNFFPTTKQLPPQPLQPRQYELTPQFVYAKL